MSLRLARHLHGAQQIGVVARKIATKLPHAALLAPKPPPSCFSLNRTRDAAKGASFCGLDAPLTKQHTSQSSLTAKPIPYA